MFIVGSNRRRIERDHIRRKLLKQRMDLTLLSLLKGERKAATFRHLRIICCRGKGTGDESLTQEISGEAPFLRHKASALEALGGLLAARQ